MVDYLAKLYIASLLALIQISSALKIPPMKILNDENKIPSIALGVANGSNTEISNAMDIALSIGYRHFYTRYESLNAAIYVKDEIEKATGKKIKNREELFITIELPDKRHQQDAVVPAISGALTRLGMEYVDLVLMSPTALDRKNNLALNIDYLETWKGMEEAKNEGLTKSIGVIGFSQAQLDRLLKNCNTKPAVIVMEVNPTLKQEAFVTDCQKKGIQVMAHISMGYLSSESKDSSTLRLDDPVIKDIMEKYKLTYPEQVIVAYLVKRDIIPIPFVVDTDKIIKYIEAVFVKLTDAESNQIGALYKNNIVEEYLHKIEKPLLLPFQ